MDLFAFSQATTVYSLHGTNNYLIQGEPYNDTSRKRTNVNTAIRNTTDSISAIDNIANPVTDNNAYPDENLFRTPFSFISDINSNSYVFNTGANHIIINDLRQFKVFHSCNGNVKVVGGSNVSIWGTSTTYTPIKSYDGTVDHVKVPEAIFVL